VDLCRHLVLALFLVGCGSDDAATDSGTPPEDSSIEFDASGLDITPPAEPTLPTITPCPDGWSEVPGDVVTCEPWALDDAPSCASHEARFVGDPACARVGPACPADGWPADLPMGATIRYVREGGTGVGTRVDPFGTLTDALVGITPGTVIAVAVGTYAEEVDVPEGVTIVGACVERTIITSDRSAIDHGVLTVVGPDVEIRDLHIGPSEQGGLLVVGAGRSAAVRNVVIEDVRAVGIDVELGGELEADDVVVRRVSPTATGQFGRGVSVENGGTVTFRRLVIEEATEFGILSLEATVTIEDAWVARTDALPDGSAGPGIVAWRMGSVTGRRVVVDENTDVGIGGNVGVLDLEQVLVRGTRTRPMDVDHGRGVNAEFGTELDCRRCVLEDNAEFGIFVDGEGTVTTFEDLVVRRTRQGEGGIFGRGITVQNRGDLRVSRVLLTENGEAGVLIGGPLPGSGTLSDVTILRMQRTVLTNMARALSVQQGASLIVDRARLEDLAEVAVLVGDPGSTAVLNDITVRDVDIVDGELPGGRGVAAQQGAAIEIHRALITDVHDLGLAAYQGDASVVATDLVVERVVELSCETGVFCRDAPGGHGIAAYVGANVSAERFRVEGAQICGVHVAADGVVRVAQGLVRGSAIGACIQSDLHILTDLQDEVRYLDNGLPLDSTDLPVPAALPRATDAM